MRFVVVTGMSGGGKRTALKLLEDAGFYCVDNLPVSLVDWDWMSVRTRISRTPPAFWNN